MLESAIEIFLDGLCLSMHPKTKGTYKLLIVIIELYETYKLKDEFFNNAIVKLCASIISDIINEDLDLENEADYSLALIKLEEQVKKNAPEYEKKIKTIFETRENITNRRITAIQKRLRSWIIHFRATKTIGTMYINSNKCTQTSNGLQQDIYLNNILESARDIITTYETPEINDDEMIEMIDLSDKESVRKAFNANKHKVKGTIVKTGLQGMNKMFGKRGGLLLGEFILFAGLSHHYKSGMLMDMTRWIATLNSPGKCNGKIPTIVFISLENEIHENMMQWYKDAYKNFYHKSCDGLDDEEIITAITEIFSKKGFRVLVFRKLGETFGYEEWAKLHIKLQNSGYHIVATVLDYVSKMKLEEGGVNDAKKRENLTGKIANFCNHNGILGISAIQLSGQAEELAGSGRNNVVKRYGAVHLADAKGLKKEADVLVFLHIETNTLTKMKYLTMMLNKHRYVSDTPDKDKYTAYQFIDKYGILDDIHGKDNSVVDIYADPSENNKTVETVDIF